MTTQRTPEDAKYWLDEAEQRLNDARRYVPKENARIRCEQAHYAAEFAIKGVIIATGESFATTHDIIKLLGFPGLPPVRREASTPRSSGLMPPTLQEDHDSRASSGVAGPEFDALGRPGSLQKLDSAPQLVEVLRLDGGDTRLHRRVGVTGQLPSRSPVRVVERCPELQQMRRFRGDLRP